MPFTESNTVEQMILDAATSLCIGAGSSVLREDPPVGWGGSLGDEFKPAKWTFVEPMKVPRQPGEVMVEPWVREALIVLNPEIAEQPDRADEVIYALRAILLSVQADGLVRANENFMAWLRGEWEFRRFERESETPVSGVGFAVSGRIGGWAVAFDRGVFMGEVWMNWFRWSTCWRAGCGRR